MPWLPPDEQSTVSSFGSSSEMEDQLPCTYHPPPQSMQENKSQKAERGVSPKGWGMETKEDPWLGGWSSRPSSSEVYRIWGSNSWTPLPTSQLCSDPCTWNLSR